MDVAEILKFATLAYLICVGIWFGTAQPHFNRASKTRPLLMLMMAVSLATTASTLAFTISATVPYVRIAITVIMATSAVLLIKWAFRSIHKKNLGLAFSGIVPDEVVQYGPYRYVRHPLYLAYCIFWASCAVLSGSIVVAVFAALIILLYFLAARSEERDLLGSDLGASYLSYRQRTGIMLPRFFR